MGCLCPGGPVLPVLKYRVHHVEHAASPFRSIIRFADIGHRLVWLTERRVFGLRIEPLWTAEPEGACVAVKLNPLLLRFHADVKVHREPHQYATL